MGKISKILAGRKARTKSIRLILNGEATAELETARVELNNARKIDKKADDEGSGVLSDRALTPDAERRYKEVEARILEDAVVFKFQAIPRKTLEALRAANPPSPLQWEIYRERSNANPLVQPPTFDPDGIASGLIFEALVEPELSEEEVGELWDELSDGEAAQLYDAAWEVSMEAATIPLSATGIDGIGDSDASSIMRALSESLGQSLPGGS